MSQDGLGSYPYRTWYVLGTYHELGFCMIISSCIYRFTPCFFGGSLRITTSRGFIMFLRMLIMYDVYPKSETKKFLYLLVDEFLFTCECIISGKNLHGISLRRDLTFILFSLSYFCFSQEDFLSYIFCESKIIIYHASSWGITILLCICQYFSTYINCFMIPSHNIYPCGHKYQFFHIPFCILLQNCYFWLI